MRRIIFITLCVAGISSTSCENKERLEEIKAELSGNKPENTPKIKESISAPAQNQAPVMVEESSDNSSAMSTDEGDNYSPDYSVDDYSPDYSNEYEGE